MAKVLVPDQFPKGLRILVVDDDVVCLKVLEQMLEKCSYKVTCRSQATSALDLLRAKKGCFDLVLSDVYMPDMDGFKLLEHIGLEMDLPVIMISGDGSTSTVLKGIRHGACDFLVKPVREEELKNLWQHVVRRMRKGNKERGNSGSFDDNDDNSIRHKRGCDDSGCASSVSEGSDGVTKPRTKKKKDADEDDEDGDDNDLENEDPTAVKKPRVVWSVELHQQFVNAVNHLGIDKAVPKKILELMNVPGLSRENVASHLQKFRLYLKRLSGVEQHQTMIPSLLRGPVNETRRLCSLRRFSNPSLAESRQIPSDISSMLQADLLGQPIDRLPLLQATLQGPPKCTNSNIARSGFAWTTNLLPPQQQQIHEQSSVLDPGPSINVQPSCVVIPSQLGSNPGLIIHNQGFNARSVESYSLAKSQLKSVVNRYFGFSNDSPPVSSCSLNAQTVPQVRNAVPLQMPAAQNSVINSFPLSGNGTGMKSIPSRFAVDDIVFPMNDNISEVKHEQNVDLIDSSIPGTSIFHHFPNDFPSAFSEQAHIGPK